jgi:hypothetical protein
MTTTTKVQVRRTLMDGAVITDRGVRIYWNGYGARIQFMFGADSASLAYIESEPDGCLTLAEAKAAAARFVDSIPTHNDIEGSAS